jgi:quinol monooxygenase YgiN
MHWRWSAGCCPNPKLFTPGDSPCPISSSLPAPAQTALVELSRQQPGCIAYELHEDLTQPGKVLFYERWADRISWENHIAGAHSAAFRAQAGDWIGDFEILQMRQVA